MPKRQGNRKKEPIRDIVAIDAATTSVNHLDDLINKAIYQAKLCLTRRSLTETQRGYLTPVVAMLESAKQTARNVWNDLYIELRAAQDEAARERMASIRKD